MIGIGPRAHRIGVRPDAEVFGGWLEAVYCTVERVAGSRRLLSGEPGNCDGFRRWNTPQSWGAGRAMFLVDGGRLEM